TMRELADRLGIRAASLYWHFPSKAALISEMSAHLFLEAIENAPIAATWQEWMRGVGYSVWDSLIDYPDSGLLVMMAELSEDQFERNTAIIQRRLEKFDIDPDDAFRLHSGIQALVTGWITFAHSPYFQQLESILDVKVAAMETLEAMIRGWQPKPMIEKS
ncbi:MAG: helix-turn-helix domain-containing protein, partial [Alteraurantiacibacter sp.]